MSAPIYRVGTKVEIVRKGRVRATGTVSRFDEDDCIGNPEQFLSVAVSFGEFAGCTLAFRRPADRWSDPSSEHGWSPRGKSVYRTFGIVEIRKATASEERA